jgi:hypothetical protein
LLSSLKILDRTGLNGPVPSRPEVPPDQGQPIGPLHQ